MISIFQYKLKINFVKLLKNLYQKNIIRVFDTCFNIKHHQKLKTALFFCQILKYFMLYGVVLLFKV